MLEKLTNLFGEVSTLMEDSLKYNIDIEEYSKQIESYNFDKIMEKQIQITFQKRKWRK